MRQGRQFSKDRPLSMKLADVTFRAYVRRMSRDKGITQAELAEKLGISHSTMTEWKRDSGKIPTWQLRKLLQTGGMTVEEAMKILEVKPCTR